MVKAALGAKRNKPVLGLDPWDTQERRPRYCPDHAHRRYREVYVKSLESHYVRTVLASRKALLRKCIDNA